MLGWFKQNVVASKVFQKAYLIAFMFKKYYVWSLDNTYCRVTSFRASVALYNFWALKNKE